MVPRAYTSDLRAEQAARTRERVVRAAAEELTERGYERTTLARVAERAGVSLETVKAHGPKRALLLAAFEVMFAGSEGQESLAARPEGRAVAGTTAPGAGRAAARAARRRRGCRWPWSPGARTAAASRCRPPS